jgi:hypothetical protein
MRKMAAVFGLLMLLGFPFLSMGADISNPTQGIYRSTADSTIVTVFAESTGTVTDGAIDTDVLSDADSIGINIDAFHVWSDSMVITSVACGYKAALDTSAIHVTGVQYAPLGDSTNTIVLITPYWPWTDMVLPTLAVFSKIIPVYSRAKIPGEFWIRFPTSAAYEQCGFFWIAVRYKTAP